MDIILKGTNLQLNLPDADHRYAMVVALANSAKTKDEINNSIEWAHNQEMEFAVLLLRMITTNPEIRENLMELKSFVKVAEAFKEMNKKIVQSRAV